MTESSDRLEKEFAEIEQQFADHPQISIVSTDGSPVNQYVVEFRLNGLVQLDDGEVVQSDQHRIEISLSFGFPHFPPNCKPLTKIFHPDMDPSAIKIAEFWSDTTSLAELIIHIGKMVCWQIYSPEDGFNQAALDWLVANASAVPMDTVQTDDEGGKPDSGTPDAEMPELSLDLSDDVASESGKFALDLPEPSFGEEIDFSFENSDKSVDVDLSPADAPSEVQDGGFELSFDDSESEALDLSLGDVVDTDSDSSFGEEIDFNFETPSSSSNVELSRDDSTTDGEEVPLTLSLENENVKPVAKDDFAFVAAGSEGADDASDDAGIVVEEVSIDEPDFTPSFPDEESVDVDLDLSAVDVDHDILKGMIDQRNFIAAQQKIDAMPDINVSKASKALQPIIEQRLEQAHAMHDQAKTLESEGLLEDAANKLEALMNLVQDYPNLEVDMKRVRDAWAGRVSTSTGIPDSNLGLERSEVSDLPPAHVRDTMLTETVVESAGIPGDMGALPATKKKGNKQSKAKKREGDSFIKKNKLLVFAAVGFLFVAGAFGWCFVEWQSVSKANQKWDDIQSLLENNEYDKVKKECGEIRSMLARVKVIMGGKRKELIGQVDDLLKSEYFIEGLEGKVLWEGEYISKMAYRAYEEINEFVEEAKRQGAASKWPESVELYEEALHVAKVNKKRLNEKFYDELALRVKKVQFVNFVSLGKKYFISTQWLKAIEKFEAALKLAGEDGVADPSVSYDVNRYLQRSWFSQYVITGDQALEMNDFVTASEKFTKAYAIAKDPQLIDEQNRQQVQVKLNQSSLIKIMDDGERYAAEKKWSAAVKLYGQAKKYTVDGYPLIGKTIVESQNKVEGLWLVALIGMEQEIARKKRGKREYVAAEEAFDRILRAINQSSLRDKPSFQKISRTVSQNKENVHMKVIVDEKITYLQKNYRQIVTENFTDVIVNALSNVNVQFLGANGRALQFKIQCREQRESKYYTLELIYQYDIDLQEWGFPEGR